MATRGFRGPQYSTAAACLFFNLRSSCRIKNSLYLLLLYAICWDHWLSWDHWQAGIIGLAGIIGSAGIIG